MKRLGLLRRRWLLLLRRHWLLSAVVVLILLGYVVPYATDYLDDPADSHQNECKKEGHSDHPQQTSRPAHPGGILKIRLTDDGAFVDRCELTDILYELNWNTPGADRAPPKPGARSLPKFVVLYIHGWKHHGEDHAYKNFKKLIHGLADDPANADKKQMLGVYVDWNATSKVPPFNWFPFDNLTFWSKQAIADRIAQSGVTTKIISSINSVMSEGENPAANQFITIGHSFGAGMLFAATNKSLIYELDKAQPPSRHGYYRPISGIVNMVILLNPAFEAARYTALDSFIRPKEPFHEDQLPLLLSVSSDGDWATEYLFPLGQMLDHLQVGAGDNHSRKLHGLSNSLAARRRFRRMRLIVSEAPLREFPRKPLVSRSRSNSAQREGNAPKPVFDRSHVCGHHQKSRRYLEWKIYGLAVRLRQRAWETAPSSLAR